MGGDNPFWIFEPRGTGELKTEPEILSPPTINCLLGWALPIDCHSMIEWISKRNVKHS